MRPSRSFAPFLAATILSILTGCNSVTGAEGLAVEEEESGGGVTAAAPLSCAYPTAGMGAGVGKVVPDHKWQGFVGESMEATEIALSDHYDCDGSKGINALLVDVSATWCGACQVEAQHLNGELKTQWEALGIDVMTLMIEDASSNPATTDTALAWKKQYNLTSSTVAADPQFYFSAAASGGGVGLPFLLIIDPRTMQLVGTMQGDLTDRNKLIELAVRNQY